MGLSNATATAITIQAAREPITTGARRAGIAAMRSPSRSIDPASAVPPARIGSPSIPLAVRMPKRRKIVGAMSVERT